MVMNQEIDIISKGDYPSDALSNFYKREFVFDGVKCASVEGLLQSFKTRNTARQREVCMLDGKNAKNAFRHRVQNLLWRITGNLYWNGVRFKRTSDDYQRLLDRVYDTVGQLDDFKQALLLTDGYVLKHSIGKRNTCHTILTEYEFISRLEKIRASIKKCVEKDIE